MLDRLIALVVPPTCLACSAPCRPGARICGACRAAIPWLGAACCPRCALPAGAPQGCAPASCPGTAAAFDRAWAATAYDGPARLLVHALKFRGATAAADVMAAQVAATAPPGLLAGVLVPVPADPARRRARGYDHADVLVRALAARTGLPARRCLVRPEGFARQLGAGRAERRRRRAEHLRTRGAVPAEIVLVDDVMTTGATLDACASALRRAGARRVAAVAYARTLP